MNKISFVGIILIIVLSSLVSITFWMAVEGEASNFEEKTTVSFDIDSSEDKVKIKNSNVEDVNLRKIVVFAYYEDKAPVEKEINEKVSIDKNNLERVEIFDKKNNNLLQAWALRNNRLNLISLNPVKREIKG